ncbi:MAG: trypsin-like peptidase domain-containing protein [Sandaracinaceae bacterium]
MRQRASALLCVLTLTACQTDPSDVGRSTEANVFGTDSRMEWYAHPDADLKDLASRSVGAWIPGSMVDTDDPDDVRVMSEGTLRMVRGVCADEAFADEPVAARCTGVIIDTDLVVTAGSCFAAATDCQSLRFVTSWRYDAAGELAPLTQDNVYSCREVIVQRTTGGMNHAIVQLDRPIAGILRPAPVRYHVDDIPLDTPVSAAGHGAGLPMKLDSEGRVVAFDANGFDATIDGFAQGYGAPVLDDTASVLGIHVSGPADFFTDGAAMCDRAVVTPDAPPVTMAARISHIALPIQELCNDDTNTSALCVGTDGSTICRAACDCPTGTTCEVQDGDITCVTNCSSPTECPDGFTCTAGRCRAGPGCFAGHVWERDVCSRPIALREECGADEVCQDGACVTAPAGDTCALAEDIAMTNTFVPVDLVEGGYRNVYRGSCGAFGPDRVWRLTVDRDTQLTVSARHMGFRLYIRRECEDTATEVACSADTNRPRIDAMLTPGVYYIFLDAQIFTTISTTVDFLFDVMPGADGGAVVDAGVSDAGPPVEMGGCGCRTAALPRSRGWLAILTALGLLISRRRRR